MAIKADRFKEVAKELKKEFSSYDVEWKIFERNEDNTKGLAVPFIKNRAIQERLDEVFTPFGWRNDFEKWHDNSQLCSISIEVENSSGGIEWISKKDGAGNTRLESIKGGLSDAMKRCAVQWGIGRYLYSLPDIWVHIVQKEGDFVIHEEELPRLRTFLETKKVPSELVMEIDPPKLSKKSNNSLNSNESEDVIVKEPDEAPKDNKHKGASERKEYVNQAHIGMIDSFIKATTGGNINKKKELTKEILKKFKVDSVESISFPQVVDVMDFIKNYQFSS